MRDYMQLRFYCWAAEASGTAFRHEEHLARANLPSAFCG